MNQLIIAFGHRKRVGKNQCVNFLETIIRTNTKGLSVKKGSFADELKNQCHRLYGWAGLKTGDYYEEHGKEREIILPALGKTPRQAWIDYGMAVRTVYEYTWLDFLLKTSKANILLISDVRFPIEFDRVRGSGGRCIKVTRDSIPDTDDVADKPLAELPDEHWDRIIKNNGTLKDLYGQMEKLFLDFISPEVVK